MTNWASFQKVENLYSGLCRMFMSKPVLFDVIFYNGKAFSHFIKNSQISYVH